MRENPVQAKEAKSPAQHEQGTEKSSEGGTFLTPPSFSVSAGPVQKKEDPAQQKDYSHLNKQGQFIMKYAKGAVELEKKHGVPATFTLGQGALESGWGKSAIGNALFGIKANKSWKGKKQLVVTHEVMKDDKQGHRFPEVISITKREDGKYLYKVKDWFRDYETVDEGLEDHSRFLIDNKRYAAAFNTTTDKTFATAVADAGYATATNYAGTLHSMINSIRKHWPSDAGSIPAGNAKAITGGTPGGQNAQKPGEKKPGTEGGGTQAGKGAAAGAATGAAAGGALTIKNSVGEGGVNATADALVVKGLLIQAGYDLSSSAAVGPKTIGFIKDFQKKTFGWKNPDGLVEPGGTTFKGLAGSSGQVAEKPKEEKKEAPKGQATNYKGYAEKLYAAMHETFFGTGWGTDEAAVYAVLARMGRDTSKLQKLRAAYKSAYKRDLVADLRSEFSESLFQMMMTKYLSAPKDKGKEDTKTPAKDKGTETTGNSNSDKLNQFYSDFSNIKVVHGEKTVNVKPPYHINSGDRKTNALAARKGNSKVTKLISDLKSAKTVGSTLTLGKAQPHELKAVLEEAVSRGLVTHDATSMHDFLAKYGLSVDCSGYVSQALNFMMDGNMKVDSKDGLDPLNTSSGMLKGGSSGLTKVAITSLKPGDTMHVSGHIRIINEVVKDGDTHYFKTAESTAKKDGNTKQNGLMKRWWKYEGSKTYYTWKSQNGSHPKSDAEGWVQSFEKNTYGRYDKLTEKDA